MSIEIVNANQLAGEMGLRHKFAHDVIVRAKLPVQMEARYGRGTLRYYNRADATRVVQAAVDKLKTKIKPASTPPIQAAPVLSLGGVESRLKLLEQAVAELTDVMGTFKEAQAALKEQNIVIMRKLNAMDDRLGLVISELGVKEAA